MTKFIDVYELRLKFVEIPDVRNEKSKFETSRKFAHICRLKLWLSETSKLNIGLQNIWALRFPLSHDDHVIPTMEYSRQ